MTGRWKIWWSERSQRERQLLTLMFALLAVFAIWLTYRTVGNGVRNARENHQSALVEQARVKDRIQLLKAFEERHSGELDMPIAMFVNQSATATGFVLTEGDAAPENRADVAIASARPLALFQWVAALEAQGVVPETFVARANADRTLNVRARFRGRAQ